MGNMCLFFFRGGGGFARGKCYNTGSNSMKEVSYI